MHRGESAFCKIIIPTFRDFCSFKKQKNSNGWDPPHRFTDAYLNVLQTFPRAWPAFEQKKMSALIIEFQNDSAPVEHHGLLITPRTIDHFEPNNSKIPEHVVSWLCVDILKRLGIVRTIESVSTTLLSVKEKLTQCQQGDLVEFFLYFRLQKKTPAAILKKLKAGSLPLLLQQFDKRPQGSWKAQKQ